MSYIDDHQIFDPNFNDIIWNIIKSFVCGLWSNSFVIIIWHRWNKKHMRYGYFKSAVNTTI